MADAVGDRELDAWLALKVMGWEQEASGTWYHGNGRLKALPGGWHPTTSHDQAFMVLARANPWGVEIQNYRDWVDWRVALYAQESSPPVIGNGPLCLAICRAARAYKESRG